MQFLPSKEDAKKKYEQWAPKIPTQKIISQIMI